MSYISSRRVGTCFARSFAADAALGKVLVRNCFVSMEFQEVVVCESTGSESAARSPFLANGTGATFTGGATFVGATFTISVYVTPLEVIVGFKVLEVLEVVKVFEVLEVLELELE